MKFIKKLLPILVLSLILFSCDDDDPVVPKTNTIVDIAIENNLSSLVAAVTRAELVTTLSSGDYTVLAPTNAAFDTFLEANGFATVNDVPVDVLRNILLNHVINGSLRSTDLSTSYASTNAVSAASGTNMSIYINVGDNLVFNGIATVDIPNVTADNGVVHVVDAVISLPTVVTFAVADPNFNSLEAALTRETSFTYVAKLSTQVGTTPAPFTVFAPTNEAFASLISDDLPADITTLADIDTATLTSTLNTHVYAGANVLDSGLSDGMEIPTLGGTLTANVTGGATLTDPNGRVSAITATNVQANNGVIHVINKVLLE